MANGSPSWSGGSACYHLRARDGYIRRGLRISLRSFARMHGLAAETWRREYRRGAAGATVRIGNRWAYAEYDPARAADSVREGKSNMGASMRLTVVSGRGGRGGLLVMIDRCSRRYVAERIGHVSQDCVVRAIGRMRARGALPVVRTVTTDNGCEFPGQRRLDGALGAEVYYTRAYASYEKGAIENCNRLVRRWYPKGTDFSRVTRREIRDLEGWINSMHRESLNRETAYDYDSCLPKKN